ncbi:hypothetical protein PRZ48_001674 [Zasmidium cellare]|uniref:Transcription factor domain-containing protein n=1 Tax=Zasmidium cellare TaxID=395010 RepID=A0ABR0F1W5_ZASCE|nr:hypothetical protein PRZ48_001674 [Zasmidium cellare]
MLPPTDEDDTSGHQASLDLIARLPRLRVEDPYGVIDSSSIADLHELSQWFFASQVDGKSSARWITSSSHAWGEHFWNVASRSDVSFSFLMLLVVHKRTVLSGRSHSKDFYLMQSRLIRLLQQSVNEGFAAVNPEAALAMCGLALFALREGDHATARAHMMAVQALDRVHSLQGSACWVMCSWMDLFIATAFAWPPFLPFRLPSLGDKHTSATPERLQEARRNAIKASKSIPRFGDDFGNQELFDLLSKLSEACFIAEDRNIVTQAPSNLLYLIAFRLCQLSLTAKPHIRVLIVAMQLCWLSAGRFWLPQARPLWPSLLVRLDASLQGCPDLVARWQEEGCLAGLLWVSLVGYQNSRQYSPGLALRFVAIAKCTRELLGITRLHDLRRQMSSFPGIPMDKEAAVRMLWETIRPSSSAQWVALTDEDVVEQNPTCTDLSQSKKFVTIFQFETLDDSGVPSCRHWLNNWGQKTGDDWG